MKRALKSSLVVCVLVSVVVFSGIVVAGDIIVKEGDMDVAGEVKITGSDGTSGDAPDVLVVSGGIGGSDDENGLKGGSVKVTGGAGGKVYTGTGGDGGDIIFTSGEGGQPDNGPGGAGGAVKIMGGAGGSKTPGGAGGGIEITGGNGGGGEGYAPGGAGADIKITAGAGGSSSGCGGDGGDIELTTGEPGGGANGEYGDVILAKNGGFVGIGGVSPSYPFVVDRNASGISIWSQGDVSATGYITRTSVYDKSGGSALDYIRDADYYKDDEGNVVHSKFYGYTTSSVTDFSRPETEKVEADGEVYEVTVYPHQRVEEGVMIDKEVDVLRQAVWELKEEIEVLKAALGQGS